MYYPDVIYTFPRGMSRDKWRTYWRIARKAGAAHDRGDKSLIAERGDFARRVAAATVDGAVCVVTSGRDCDCVDFVQSRVATGARATVLALWRDREHAHEWADGPIHHGYCTPAERPANYSRDLIAEAYENGHPHFVTAATV